MFFGWLFLGRLLAGIMGASFTTANAYIADVSTPDTRARNFGFVGVAFGLGFIFGPAIYLYARKRLQNDWLGAVMATVYLLHPAVSWTNMENFHPDAFLGVFVGINLIQSALTGFCPAEIIFRKCGTRG